MPAKKELPPELIEKVIELVVEGKGYREIMAETKMSQDAISKVYRSSEFVLMVKGAAQRAASKHTGVLLDKLMVLVKQGNIKAIELMLKVSGVLSPEQAQVTKTDQQITVILPGAEAPKTFEVSSADFDSEEN